MITRLYKPSWIRVGVLILLACATNIVSILPPLEAKLTSDILASTTGQNPTNIVPADIAWSPDGTMIAEAGLDLLRIWDVATDKPLIDLESIAPGHVNLSISWSPDSKKLVSATDDGDGGMVRVWNIADSNDKVGQVLATINPTSLNGNGFLWAVAWSPDGTAIATGTTGEGYDLKIWDANNYILLDKFRSGWIRNFSWYQDHSVSRIAIVNENELPRVQSILLDAELPVVMGNKIAAGSISWNSDGDQIVVGYEDGSIRIWDVNTNTLNAEMIGERQNFVRGIAWSPDNSKIASANGDSTIGVWNSSTGELIWQIQTDNKVYAVDFSPDGAKIAYGGLEGVVIIVDVSSLEIVSSP